MDIELILELMVFVILMMLSGFFSSSETALFSLDKRQLEQMRRNDNPQTNRVEKMLSEPRRLIVTILIGNEFVNVAASVISAAVVIKLMGAENKMINLLVMIPILLLVGEITPKTLAIRNNVGFATFQARPIELFAKILTPLRWLIRLIADFFTTLIVGAERTQASMVTEDMVRTLAREAVGDGVLDHDEARYIERIFNFSDKTLEEIQTPRSRVFFLSASMPPSEMLASLRKTRYTKIPVFREHRDEIVGVLHSRDLLGVDLSDVDEHPDRLLKLLRQPYFVPETKTAAELFRTFRKRKLSLAVTVDEYGGVIGLVTMENLLECIFGDIPSASDANEEVDVEMLSDGSTQVEGTITIEQFNEEFGENLKGEEFDTIAGMILHAHGELPAKEAAFTFGKTKVVVGEVEKNSIQWITVKPVAESGKEDKPGRQRQEKSWPVDTAPPDAIDSNTGEESDRDAS